MQIFDGRQYFWQWDLNQKLTSDDLQIGEEVHFYNTKQPKAVRAIAYEQDGATVVDVPNILLQYSIPLMVYRTVDGDFEAFSTIKEYEFEVKQRAKPNNYVVNETEILDYRTLEKKVENLEKTMVTPSWDTLEGKPFGEIDGKTVPIDEKYIPDSIARTAEIQTEISDALAEAKASGEFKGDKGDPFTYEDFTSEQLEDLKGEPFTYEDFTPEQLEKLKGEPGVIVTGASVGQYIKVKAIDENGKPTEWEAVDLEIPEAPQADWSQNDETAADYVKNRTHFTNSLEEVFILPETSVTFKLDESMGVYWARYKPLFPMIPGETYTVNFAGTEYKCVCNGDLSALGGGEGSYSVGNAVLAGGPNTGEPFAIAFVANYGGQGYDVSNIFALADVGTVSVSVYGAAENVVHQIPDKYIDKIWFEEYVAEKIAESEISQTSKMQSYVSEETAPFRVDISNTDIEVSSGTVQIMKENIDNYAFTEVWFSPLIRVRIKFATEDHKVELIVPTIMDLEYNNRVEAHTFDYVNSNGTPILVHIHLSFTPSYVAVTAIPVNIY